jgi:hypothetical protein
VRHQRQRKRQRSGAAHVGAQIWRRLAFRPVDVYARDGCTLRKVLDGAPQELRPMEGVQQDGELLVLRWRLVVRVCA